MMTLRRNVKITAVFLFCIVMILCGLNATYACTAIYVGKDASDDGTVMIAKSNDYQDVWANYVEIKERVEDEPGRVMPAYLTR